jgi:hypothetical protein
VVERVALVEIQLVEIAAGGHFAMYASTDVAFCQVVRGAGKLGLPTAPRSPTGPGAVRVPPGALHDRHDVTQDTLLSVCLVRAG